MIYDYASLYIFCTCIAVTCDTWLMLHTGLVELACHVTLGVEMHCFSDDLVITFFVIIIVAQILCKGCKWRVG